MPPAVDERPEPTTWEWVVPYAGWGACVAGLLLNLVAERLAEQAPRWVPLAHGAAVATVALGVTSLVLLGWAALRRRSRQGLGAIGVSGGVWLLVLTGASWAVPPPPPSALEEGLRAVVDRRGTTVEETLRGVRLTTRFNRLGWPDDEFRPEAARRIVFIGDSFLEVRSTRNLAARVEEQLRAGGPDVDLVNLGQAGAGPGVEYRHRFFEIALPRRPEHVVVFVYTMNDLQPGYRFEPYRHQAFAVSASAAAVPELPPEVATAMRHLARAGTRLESRQALLDRLPAGADGELAYMAAVGYAAPPPARGPASALSAVADALLDRAHSIRGAWRRIGGGCAGYSWMDVEEEYRQVFQAPMAGRLDGVGRFIAERYCGMTDAAPFIAALARQRPGFRAWVTAEADMPYYLFPAVAEAAGFPVPAATPDGARETAAEYARLFGEMAAEARAQGVRLTVVLIPDAAMSDGVFRGFWSGLASFDRLLGAQHAMHRELAVALGPEVETLDLAAEPTLLQGAYWPLDGHFNEVGNRRVAERLAALLRP